MSIHLKTNLNIYNWFDAMHFDSTFNSSNMTMKYQGLQHWESSTTFTNRNDLFIKELNRLPTIIKQYKNKWLSTKLHWCRKISLFRFQTHFKLPILRVLKRKSTNLFKMSIMQQVAYTAGLKKCWQIYLKWVSCRT